MGGRRVVDDDVVEAVVVRDELPPIDPTTMTARQMVDEIHRRASAVNRHFHAIGTMLRALGDPERLRELGHADMDALLVKENLGSRMNAQRLATAAVLPLDVAGSLGQTKSYELVRWAREVKGARTDAAVVAIIRATTEIDGTPLAELTTRQIADAIGRPDASTRAAEAHRRAELLDEARKIRKHLKKCGVSSRTTVESRDGRRAELVIRIASIDDVERLVTVLEDEP